MPVRFEVTTGRYFFDEAVVGPFASTDALEERARNMCAHPSLKIDCDGGEQCNALLERT